MEGWSILHIIRILFYLILCFISCCLIIVWAWITYQLLFAEVHFNKRSDLGDLRQHLAKSEWRFTKRYNSRISIMALKTILCTYIELSESPFGWTALYYIGKIHRACYYPSYLLDKNSYNIFINANCKTKINLVYLHNNTFIFVHPNSPSFVKDSLLWRVVGYRRTSPFIYFNTRPFLYAVLING